MARLTVRRAKRDEADRLTALCHRSKAHWGYDEAFMRQCRDVLTVRPAAIDADRVWVVEGDGAVKGVASVADADPASECDYEIAHLFVEPAAMGEGVGRLLFEQCVAWVQSNGGGKLEILSDPGAASFYQRMGARLVGEAPSDAIPSRRLPLLIVDV